MKFNLKTFAAVAISFVFNGCISVHASNIIFDGLTDQNGKPINRDITLTLLSQPLANGRGLSFDIPKTYRMTNYTVTASNVIGGNFALSIQGLRQSLYLNVLNDSNTYPFMQLVTNSLPTLNTSINLYQFDTNLFVVSGKNVTLKSLTATNVNGATGNSVNLSGKFSGVTTNIYDYAFNATNNTSSNNGGRRFFANYRQFGVWGTNNPDFLGNADNYVLCDLDGNGYGHVVIGCGPAGVIYLGNSAGQAIFPASVQAADFIGANSYQSASGRTNIDENGNFYGYAGIFSNGLTAFPYPTATSYAHSLVLPFWGAPFNGSALNAYSNSCFIADIHQGTAQGGNYIQYYFNAAPDVNSFGARFIVLDYDPSGTFQNLVEIRQKAVFLSDVNLSGNNLTNANFAGTFTGNGSGLTSVPASALVGGFTGIVTNWATGMGGNSNRLYFSFGIVTNVTRP